MAESSPPAQARINQLDEFQKRFIEEVLPYVNDAPLSGVSFAGWS